MYFNASIIVGKNKYLGNYIRMSLLLQPNDPQMH